MRIPTAWWLVAAVSLVIAGCGGGGGGTTCTTNCVSSTLSVATVSPANGATGVAVGSAVTATFNIGVNASSVTGSTFTLTQQGGGAVAGTVSVSNGGLTATFTPTAPLANNTAYTATITTGVQSLVGTALASNYTWSFTTGSLPAPAVSSVTPTNGLTGVNIASTVTATFNQAMDSSTITSSTFTLTPAGGSAIAATVSYAANVATLTPTAQLVNNTTYTATITTGVTSSAGSALAANYTWTFTTVAATVTAPQVTVVTPTNNSTGVAISTTVTATFSEAMDSTTITPSTFTLTGPGTTSVQGTVSYNASTSVATFIPAANLAYNTTYVATLSASIMSSSEVALAPYSWSFTTAAAPVPTVTTTVPANGATGVNVGNALTATFSQPMNSATLTASTFTLTGPGNTAVAGLISYNTGTSTVTFTPNASLTYNTLYTATITTGAQSSNGAGLASNYVWTFTTGASPNQVTVDFGTTYQTIRGFGGSTAWLGEMPSAVATALFSPTSGLGLSILRVRIDPEGSSTGGGTKGDPYETSEWDSEAANGAEAVAANSKAIVFASPWTPPATWKLSGTSTTISGVVFNEAFNSTCGEGAGFCGGYLDPNHYADYANYLEDFVKFFNATNSFNLYAISMQNEPEVNQSYESCVWTPQQMDSWVAGNASTITSDAYSTKFIMPESESFNSFVASPTLNDTNAQGLVSIIGGHLYGVQPAPYSIPSGDSPKELWMTEFGPLSNATLTWAQALTTYGESIHNSMVTGQYNAYVWWGLFGASSGTCATNAGTCGLVDDAGNVQPMGYVMGQYSKFIQPGFVRVSATASPVSGVFASAYSSSSPSHYAIVIINANSTPESLSFVLNNGSGVTSLTPYESTSAAGLAPQNAVAVPGGQFSYTLPAQSIVTFYQ